MVDVFPVTEISEEEGAYTANWKEVPEASYYQFYSYGVNFVDEKPQYTLLEMLEVSATLTSLHINNLDVNAYDAYAYAVETIIEDGWDVLSSGQSRKVVVDFGTSGVGNITGVDGVGTDRVVEVARFAADGTQIDKPVKGVNVVRYSDGTVRKVMVK